MKFLRGGIRRKFVRIILISSIPMMALLAFLGYENRQFALRQAEQEVALLVSGAVEIQERITTSTGQLLQTLTALPQLRSGDQLLASRILAILLETNPIYTNVILVDRQGDVVAAGRPVPQGLNFADRLQFREAMTTKQMAAGEFVIGKATGKAIFPFGVPVMSSSGRVEGVVIIGVDLSRYEIMFRRAKFPSGSFFGICDKNGNRLYRVPHKSSTPVGSPISSAVFAAASEYGTGRLATTGSDGIEYIISFRSVALRPNEPPYLYLFSGIPRTRVLAGVNLVVMRDVTVTLLALVLAAAISLHLAGRTIGAQIQVLTDAVVGFGRGKPWPELPIDPEDGEMGKLAEKCTAMARTIIDREDELQMTNRDLEESNQALDQALAEAEAASTAKSEFLANMSHELRTPLNGIMGTLQLLEPRVSELDPEKFMGAAMSSCRRINRLVDDILDISRIEAGRLEMRHAPFDLAEVVGASCEMFALAAARKGIQFHTELAPRLPGVVKGDSVRLQQVLDNLLGNALKFTDSGRIEVGAYPLPPRSDREARALFMVSDTGCGIPDSLQHDMFEKFTQADTSMTRSHQGAGLGLAICLWLVELMEGHITVESREGEGTVVYFCATFGLPEESDIRKAQVVEAGAATVSARRVLLAEDDRLSRTATSALLRRLGVETVVCENGLQALELLRRESVDMVFMDVQMPVLDGVEATAAIRAGEAGEGNRNLPVVALTAYAMADHRERLIKEGMDEHLAKPVEQADLVRILSRFGRRGRS